MRVAAVPGVFVPGRIPRASVRDVCAATRGRTKRMSVFGKGPWKYVLLAPMGVALGVAKVVRTVTRIFKRK
jgi:hypothetical protein